ncbi:hypothetical protein [Neolewinella agarilytica]|uniref:hypothetical protein n=1 Tax=Neolewinella agarilytica TaxID=478744 RepID=UPI002353B21F|nr:hypothetical protein [Neolewinella agarilytica]
MLQPFFASAFFLCTRVRAQLICLLFLLVPPLFGQPQTDPIRTVENITPQTNAYAQKARELMQAGENAAATDYNRDSLLLALLGQEVTPSYLVDRKGAVWNLGVMDQPFIIHTFFLNCGHCEHYVDAINSVATAFADEVITFVLMPTPEADGLAMMERFNDDVVIIFDDHFRDPYSMPDDPRLLGLIGYPITHYITGKRRIVGLNRGGGQAFIHPRKGAKIILKKRESDVEKRLRKGVGRLLEF